MRQGSAGEDHQRAGVVISRSVPARGETQRTWTRPSATSDALDTVLIGVAAKPGAAHGEDGDQRQDARGPPSVGGTGRARVRCGAAAMVVGGKTRGGTTRRTRCAPVRVLLSVRGDFHTQCNSSRTGVFSARSAEMAPFRVHR